MIALIFNIDGLVQKVLEVESDTQDMIQEYVKHGMAIVFPSVEAAREYVRIEGVQHL